MDTNIILGLFTLIALEVILGIDNVIFISILANKLPPDEQKKARRYGLILAAALRIILLFGISFILKLDKPMDIFGYELTGKQLILIIGGLFLVYKAAKEIHHKVEGENGDVSKSTQLNSFKNVLFQILIMDLVFSVDSIITAVGMVKELWVMYVSVIVTVIIMLVAAAPISNFINKHPAFKILALAFLMIIGVSLIAEGFGYEIPKGYIYFSIAFALAVDILQLKITKKSDVKKLNEHYTNNK
jgi:predicted tellurium resistance membrane protein TerC